jgi:hypothetical protein
VRQLTTAALSALALLALAALFAAGWLGLLDCSGGPGVARRALYLEEVRLAYYRANSEAAELHVGCREGRLPLPVAERRRALVMARLEAELLEINRRHGR